jgi:hypothetical protein
MRRLAVAVGAVLVLAVGGVAWAAIPNGDGNIYACYNTGDGSVRVKDDPAKPCAKGWSPLKWTASQPQIPPPPHIPVTTTYRLRSENQIEPNGGGLFELPCRDGDVAAGGGFYAPSPGLRVFISAPRGPGDESLPTSWQVGADNAGPNGGSIAAFVVCQHTE